MRSRAHALPPLQLLTQLEKALVSRGAHVASSDGVANGAVGLHFVTAVDEAAFVEEGAQLGKALVEGSGRQRPHAHLPQARRVGDVAALGAG